MEAYRKSVELRPLDGITRQQLAAIYVGQGRDDEALALFEGPDGVFGFTSDKSRFPGIVATYSRVLVRKGHVDKALKSLQGALRLRPDAAQLYLTLAATLRTQGYLNQAITVLQEGVVQQPANAELYRELAATLREQGRLDEAKKADDQAFVAGREDIARLPPLKRTDFDGHRQRAVRLADPADPRLRDPVGGLAEAKLAAELNPKHRDSSAYLGFAYYRNGDWNSALEALNLAVETRKDRPAYNHGEYFWLAMTHCRLGDKDQARAWYKKGVAYSEKYRRHDASFERLRAEAAELLGIEKASSKDHD
jgi:tetratricopeptide (TPR) repeat protein